jgi:hypothetical protein
LLFEACAPARVERARTNYERRPLRTTLLGLFISAPTIGIGLALSSVPRGPVKLVGLVLIMLTILAGLFGSAGLSRLIGQRLASPADNAQPWRRVLRGGIVLSVSFVLPFIGWFMVLPFTLISGVGALLSGAPRELAAEPLHAVAPGLVDA